MTEPLARDTPPGPVPSRGLRSRRRIAVALGVYLVAVSIGVLTPQPLPVDPPVDRPVFGLAWLADALRNVALFAPLGAGLRLTGVRVRWIVLAGLVGSGAIELAQLAIPGRFPSVVDVASNSLGAWLGSGLPSLAHRLRVEARARPGRLAVALACTSAAIAGATSWLAMPSFPESRWYGGFTPDYGGFARYDGEVISARVGDVELPPSGPIARGEAIRHALAAYAPIEVRGRAGVPPPALAPLLSIVDDAHTEILLLGVDGDDLVYHLRSRADRVGLHPPMGVVRDALARLRPGDAFALRVERGPSTTTLRLDDGAAHPAQPGLARGWAYLLPQHGVTPGQARALDALWLALLVAPVAWGAARRPAAWAALAALLGWMAVLPASGPLAPLEAWHWAWMALVAGVVALASRWPGARRQRPEASASR